MGGVQHARDPGIGSDGIFAVRARVHVRCPDVADDAFVGSGVATAAGVVFDGRVRNRCGFGVLARVRADHCLLARATSHDLHREGRRRRHGQVRASRARPGRGRLHEGAAQDASAYALWATELVQGMELLSER